MDVATIPSNWHDAFEKHSIRDVRTFEKQLQAGASRDRERLRLLVGSNYRDLLDTAEEIVSLNGLTHAAEDGISALGTLCHPPSFQAKNETRLSAASQAAQHELLVKCVLASATSSSKGLFVQSAQLLTVARLLISSLQESDLSDAFAEHTTGKISKARRSLLLKIDHLLATARSPNKLLTQLLCSYCLLSSASLADAIEHFKRLRLERLKLLARTYPDKRLLHEVTRYANLSAHLLKALLGNSLLDELQKVQLRPILEQISGHELEVLGLDINQNLIPHDISNFTPFIQRTVLTAADTKAHLQQFNEVSASCLKECADAYLNGCSNVSKILLRRTETVETLLSSSFHVHFPIVSIKLIDSSFVGRISELIKKHGMTLRDLSSEIPQFTHTEMPQSLWEDLSHFDSQGKSSPSHAKNVRNAHLGTASQVHHFIRRLDMWSRKLEILGDQIDQIQNVRWQDKITDYDDEDEPEVEAIVRRLSHEDAIELKMSLQDVAFDSVRALQLSIAQAAAKIRGSVSSDSTASTASQATTLLRLIRSVQLILQNKDTATRLALQDDMIRSLRGVVVSQIINDLEKEFEEKNSGSSQARFAAEDLPSPLAFSVLQYLCGQMGQVGGHDIWTRPMVDLLKAELTERVLVQTTPSRYACSELDREYLRTALAPRRKESGSGSGTDVNAEVRFARAYWQKTRALFGILEA